MPVGQCKEEVLRTSGISRAFSFVLHGPCMVDLFRHVATPRDGDRKPRKPCLQHLMQQLPLVLQDPVSLGCCSELRDPFGGQTVDGQRQGSWWFLFGVQSSSKFVIGIWELIGVLISLDHFMHKLFMQTTVRGSLQFGGCHLCMVLNPCLYWGPFSFALTRLQAFKV